MNNNFSIEALKTKIFSTRTSKYFEEVHSSYIHGNYRSAVVMLWTVVVLDIMQKLQSLKDSYDDEIAINILDYITEEQGKDRKSSKWELTIIEKVSKQTDLLDDYEYQNFEYLQKQRHLSAHPVIRTPISEVELYIPNKDLTRALIRNALETLLIKPPLYTDRILASIQNDLNENGAEFSDLEDLNRYVTYKYLNKLTQKSKLKLFQIFWKFAMQLDNTDCNASRRQNIRFLITLAQDNPDAVYNLIESSPDYYSRIQNEKNIIRYLIIFLYRVPKVYQLLNDDIKMLIEQRLDIDDDINLRILSFYTVDSLSEHYEKLHKYIEENTYEKPVSHVVWKRLYAISDSVEIERMFFRTLSLYYSLSGSFDEADLVFTTILEYIDKFDLESINYLLEKSEENSQTYDRRKASEEYKVIQNKITDLKPDFDFSVYPEFNRQVNKDVKDSPTLDA